MKRFFLLLWLNNNWLVWLIAIKHLYNTLINLFLLKKISATKKNFSKSQNMNFGNSIDECFEYVIQRKAEKKIKNELFEVKIFTSIKWEYKEIYIYIFYFFIFYFIIIIMYIYLILIFIFIFIFIFFYFFIFIFFCFIFISFFYFFFFYFKYIF